ncbi:MAG: phage major capsid protein [Anaerolineae bacterium]|nr:phage major capsid protein [Anaerolineae bacterium]
MSAPPAPRTVKALDATGRIGGYLAVWGSADQRDLQDEYFTPATDFGLDWYETRPVLYQHALDDAIKTAALGVIDTLRKDDVGLWVEAQLDKRNRYVQAVLDLIARGALSWSSGSMPHLVKTAPDGCIERWVIVEGSLTPTPAEPRLTDVHTLKAAITALTLPEHGGLMNDMPESRPTEPISPTPKRLPSAVDEAVKSGHIEVGSAYDTLDAFDLLHGCLLLAGTRTGKGVSERYANALAAKVRRAGWSARKSDELSYTAQSDYGAEWVPALWSAQLWAKARQDNVVLPLFRQLEMPSNPFYVPAEGVDPKVVYVPETRHESQLALNAASPAIPSDKIGTAKVELTAQKLALRVGFSAELVEDAVLPVLGIYREQAVRAILDSIDNVLLNGDTTTGGGNLNDSDGTLGDTEAFLAFDGLRHLPLVTNTANRVDFASAPTLVKMRSVRFKMAARYSAKPSDLAWIVDSNTYAALLALPEFLTMDKAGVHATALTGQLGFIDGIPVLVSAEMPLTLATGLVEVGGANDKGTAVLVYRPGWLVGTRRRVAVSVDYLPYYDAYQMTATVRLAFARYDDEVAAAGYDITV